MSFGDWCTDYGYSDDSINAFRIYRECCKNAERLAKVFTFAQRSALRDATAEL